MSNNAKKLEEGEREKKDEAGEAPKRLGEDSYILTPEEYQSSDPADIAHHRQMPHLGEYFWHSPVSIFVSRIAGEDFLNNHLVREGTPEAVQEWKNDLRALDQVWCSIPAAARDAAEREAAPTGGNILIGFRVAWGSAFLFAPGRTGIAPCGINPSMSCASSVSAPSQGAADVSMAAISSKC